MPLTPSFQPCVPILSNGYKRLWSYTEDQFLELYRLAYLATPKERKTLLDMYNISMRALQKKVGVMPENMHIDVSPDYS